MKCKDHVGTYVGGSPAQSPCALCPVPLLSLAKGVPQWARTPSATFH